MMAGAASSHHHQITRQISTPFGIFLAKPTSLQILYRAVLHLCSSSVKSAFSRPPPGGSPKVDNSLRLCGDSLQVLQNLECRLVQLFHPIPFPVDLHALTVTLFLTTYFCWSLSTRAQPGAHCTRLIWRAIALLMDEFYEDEKQTHKRC